MASKLRQFAKVKDLDKIRHFLFAEDANLENSRQTYGSRNDWSSCDLNCAEQVGLPPKGINAAWLQDCIISISPTCDLLVFARRNRAIFLQTLGSADFNDCQTFSVEYFGVLDIATKPAVNNAHKASTGTPQSYDDFEVSITTVLCLPVASSRQSEQNLGAPAWSVVLIGCSNGGLYFYTVKGELLCWQHFTERPESIISIRFQSYADSESPSPVEHDKLTLLLTYSDGVNPRQSVSYLQSIDSTDSYANLLFIIDGRELLSVLKKARDALARRCAAGEQRPEVSALQLPARKFIIPKGGVTPVPFADHAVCGSSKTSVFQQLCSVSLSRGFRATLNTDRPPVSSCNLLLCGDRPSFAVHQIVDDTSAKPSTFHQALSYSVGGLFGLFRGNNSNELKTNGASTSTKGTRKVTPEVSPLIFPFFDDRRACISIAFSSESRLAAVVDNLGRVLVINARNGNIERLLKGARDGCCGWLQVTENREFQSSQSSYVSNYSSRSSLSAIHRKVQCIVVYAPRRKVLELFLAIRGPQVATFSVTAFGRLLYTEHRLLGLDAQLAHFYADTTPQSYFLDDRGQLFTFDVPFQVVANDGSAIRSRDLLALKRVTGLCEALSDKNKADLKNTETEAEILQLIASLEVHDIILDALRLLVAVPHLNVSVVEEALRYTLERENDVDNTLRRFSRHYINLISIYQFFVSLSQVRWNEDPESNQPPEDWRILNQLQTSLQSLSDLEAAYKQRESASAIPPPSLSSESVNRQFMPSDLFRLLPFERSHFAAVDKAAIDTKLSSFLFKVFFSEISVEAASCVTDELIEKALHMRLSYSQLLQAAVIYWLTDHDRFSLCDCRKLASLLGKLAKTESDVESFSQIVLIECSVAARLVSAFSLVRVFRSLFSSQLNIKYVNSLAMLDARLRTLIDFKRLLMLNVQHGFNLAAQHEMREQHRDLKFLQSISVSGTLRSGRGAFTELFSKSLAAFWNVLPERKFIPGQLLYFFGRESDLEDEEQEEERFRLFGSIARCLVRSFDRNNLLLNISWELLAEWAKTSEEVDLLFCAVDLMAEFHTPAVVGGTLFHCYAHELMWRVHFARIVADLTSLLQKFAHLPADRIIRKHVSLSERALRSFLEGLLYFLEIFTANVQTFQRPDVDQVRYNTAVVDVFIEDGAFFDRLEVEGGSASSNSFVQIAEEEHMSSSLLELLQEQEVIDLQLVEARTELILCLLIVSQLRISVHPSAIFRSAFLDLIFAQPEVRVSKPSNGDSRFDRPLRRTQSPDDIEFDYFELEPGVNVNSVNVIDWHMRKKAAIESFKVPIGADMQKERHIFLKNAVMLYAKLLVQEHESLTQASNGTGEYTGETVVQQLDVVKRGKQIFRLAHLFQCDVDSLYRCFVIELYAYGLDQVAAFIRHKVENKRALLADLIAVVSTRLAVQLVVDVTWSARSIDNPILIDALRYRLFSQKSLENYLQMYSASYMASGSSSVWKGMRLPSLQTNCELLEFLATGCGSSLQDVQPHLFEIYQILADVLQSASNCH